MTAQSWIKSNFRHSSPSCAVLFTTVLWATHVFLGVDLVPAGTVLVTPTLKPLAQIYYFYLTPREVQSRFLHLIQCAQSSGFHNLNYQETFWGYKNVRLHSHYICRTPLTSRRCKWI